MVEKSGINLIDVAAAVLRNRMLFLILPVLAGVGTVLIKRSMDEPVYVSTSYLRLNEEQARTAEALIRSPAVLDPLLKAVPLPGTTGKNPLRDIQAQNQKLKLIPSNNQTRRLATLFTLSVEDPNPERALKVNQTILDVWLSISQPAPASAVRFANLVERAEDNFENIQLSLERLTKQAANEGPAAQGVTQMAIIWPSMVRDLAYFTRQLKEMNKDLSAINREMIVAPPTLPIDPKKTNQLQFGLAAAAVTAIGIVVAIYLRLLYLHHAPALRARLNNRSKKSGLA